MSFADDLTLVEVRDSWLKADGSPENGTITFTPSAKVRDLTTGQQIAPTGLKLTLDNRGQISALLPATDDPDYDPVGWTYHVDVQLDGYRSSYSISVPQSFAADGIDLGLLDAVPTSPGTFNPFDVTAAAFEAALVLAL